MPQTGRMTSVSTHEMVEAMTDNVPTPASSPDYPQAWNDSMGNEMGDLCNASGTVTTDFGTFTVQTILPPGRAGRPGPENLPGP